MDQNLTTGEMNEFLLTTLACIGDGVIATDLKGTILYMNTSAVELTGWKLEEALGKPINQVLPIINMHTNEVMDLVDRVLKAGTAIGLKNHSTLISKEGKKSYVSASCSPIKLEDQSIDGIVVVFRDITIRKYTENQLKKTKEEAEAANKSKSEFLANMSHEIRTPIHGMLGMIDLTLLTDLNQEQRENLIVAKSCASSLLSIINDILDFSKMEAGKLNFQNINFNVKQLLEGMMKAHTHMAKNKGLEMNYSFSTDLPAAITGDPNRLQQILNNLIHNAIKFTQKGGVTVSVKKLQASENDIELKFAIADTGRGIAQKDKPRLFKAFSQIDGSVTRKHGGTGLGLVISKQLVEMMGGSIWVESKESHGSTFYFTAKFKQAENIIEEEYKQEPIINPSSDCKKILLAEDDAVNQIVIKKILEKRGHAVDIANNGKEVLMMYENNNYDLILMDIQMPEIDGIEATKHIREREAATHRHTPVIAVTAYALKGDKERFMLLGMDEYISKPVEVQELFDKIDRITTDKINQAEFQSFLDVRINDNNEIVLIGAQEEKTCKDRRIIIKKIETYIQRLKTALDSNKLEIIEKQAHEIKKLSDSIDAQEIKRTAFRIELAIRRGNLQEVIMYVLQIEHEFDTYKKSIIIA
ncbi:sensory/regulatory protein RpfC [Clostridium aceticum]|uniref:Circadian input-output histidine kinase CikA n=1 Tax=Clostridium aceticum TaxID=84022 RepID=A0A0D8ICB7_9CLOT|nr:hybrid sensor histidine kinase/response regulator [Clostridium aceticum]AKL96896.1 sensory/regulatory protein RpfC [Clostridium aceticum]KJF27632.1 hypothetical protein TZ02_07595 [Clostridium aceticum]